MYKVTSIVLHPGLRLPSPQGSWGTWITPQRATGGITRLGWLTLCNLNRLTFFQGCWLWWQLILFSLPRFNEFFHVGDVAHLIIVVDVLQKYSIPFLMSDHVRFCLVVGWELAFTGFTLNFYVAVLGWSRLVCVLLPVAVWHEHLSLSFCCQQGSGGRSSRILTCSSLFRSFLPIGSSTGETAVTVWAVTLYWNRKFWRDFRHSFPSRRAIRKSW